MELKFYYDDKGVPVQWTYAVRPKKLIFYKNWRPKKQNIKVIGLTDEKENARLQQEILDDINRKEHPKKEKLTGMYARRTN
tara:strand:- start:928 stop:1170 length:243 start_codon:yes stop_codon:yes gene_type:complete